MGYPSNKMPQEMMEFLPSKLSGFPSYNIVVGQPFLFSNNYNNNDNDSYNFYIAPTLYDTLQRFTLKLLPSSFDE